MKNEGLNPMRTRGRLSPSKLLTIVLAVVLGAGRPAAAGPEEVGAEGVDYLIVVTGGELLAGAYADAHIPFLTRSLHPLGFRCLAAVIVEDAVEEIQEAVGAALERVPLVIVTGGLGPTPDDVTREALSALTGVPLREHPDLLAKLEERFGTPRDELRANLRRQTEVPVDGGFLANDHGTAAGLLFEHDAGLIAALPGPPRELQPMVHDHLVPLLTERFGTSPPGDVLTIRFVGIGESLVDHTISEHIPIPDGVAQASLFEGMRVDFYFTLTGATADGLAELDRIREEVLRHLGEYVYATDSTTLEEHVVDLLVQRDKTVALAEVGSGGSLAAALGSADAIAGILAGAYIAPDKERLSRMLADSLPPAAAAPDLARRLAERTGADLALAVGPATLDDGGGRSVEVAYFADGHTATHRLALRGTGETARFHLTTQFLDLLRRRLR